MQLNNKKIGIIIINYNQPKLTLNCLYSIKKHIISSLVIVNIYLIENNSDIPISQEQVNSVGYPISFISNPINSGFAEGNNVGMKMAMKDRCDYMVLINNDTEFIDNSFFDVITMLEANDQIGIGGMVNYYLDQPNEVWQAGFKDILSFNDKKKRIDIFENKSNHPIICDYVPGSSFFIKREVIESIGYLDADYFAYLEEMDFCVKAKLAGFSTAFLPSSKILHKVGRSSASQLKLYLRTRNKLKFYKTYFTKTKFLLAYFYFIYATIKALRYESQKLKYIRTTLIAIKDFHSKNYGYGSIATVLNNNNNK